MSNATFCEGCPFSNGVKEANELIVNGFKSVSPNPGFDILFADRLNPSLETHSIHAIPPDIDTDFSWPGLTSEAVLRLIDACDSPVEIEKKRLGGLLGASVVKRCGAFPDQQPTHINIMAIGKSDSRHNLS